MPGQFELPVLAATARLTPLHVLTALPFVYFAIVQNQAIYSESFGVIKDRVMESVEELTPKKKS